MRRALAAVGLVGVVLLGATVPASAHGGAVASTDYRTRVTDVEPAVDELELRLIEAGGRLELVNRTGEEVVVLGYEDEPYLRITADGVFENRRSPAVYLNATRTGGVPVPGGAGPDAEPRWVRVDDGPTARWHDHRLHWMTGDPEEVRAHPDRRHAVARWDLPIRVGHQAVTARGEIVYVPGPAIWPWLTGAAALAIATFALARRRWLAAAVAVLVLADAVRVAGLTFVLLGGAGERLEQAVDVGVLSLVGWGLGVFAVVRLLRGTGDGRTAAGLTAVLLAVAGGFLEWDDIGRSQIAFAWSADLARLCVAVTTGLGTGIAAGVLAEAGALTGAGRRRTR